MPYEWLPPDEGQARLRLRPHRSLGVRGFVAFIAVTAALLSLPVLTLLGRPALWMILAFIVTTVWGLWVALRRNARDLDLIEEFTLTRDEARLVRRAPGMGEQVWSANPYWVSVQVYPSKGPVEHYLTLKGAGREVELGAFLTPEERIALADELRLSLAGLH
jgi:uncharacterized membrane protein